MNEQPLHVVFGAGQVGSHLAEFLLERGFRVRVAKRNPTELSEGIEIAFGDATDEAFCRQATEGASVVYHCMNPPYDIESWEKMLPPLQQNLVTAAGAADARLVVLENLYMVGRPDGPITAETPFEPRSRKGEIRARMARDLRDAHDRGDARIVSGRASDFYGPRGTATHFGDHFWKPAVTGKKVPFLPDPDTPHTYHYIPDVARGLLALGLGPDEATGQAWMLPCAPAESSRAMVGRFSQALGQEIRLRRIPPLVSRALGIFMPMMREIGEMLHQWEVPFVVDDSRFREHFEVTPTDLPTGTEATVQWARRHYSPS